MNEQRIAVIGFGLWGKNIVRNFYNLNVLDTVCDLDDEEFIEDSADKVIKRRYYRNNHMSDAEFDTKEVIETSDAQFEQCRQDQVSEQLYIASGMYAVEREIIKYAEKYALAVKAKGLYDAVLYMMDGVEDECQVIEEAKRLEKEELLSSYWADSPDSGKRRKYYKITQKGLRELEMQKEEWETYQKAVNRVIGGVQNAVG